jgi:endonuclease YncB( thermonuclease family)
MRGAGVILLVLLLMLPARAQKAGSVQVLDGDTLELAGRSLDLHGIDAPEPAQRCARQGRLWSCGEAATRALERLTAGRSVRCVIVRRPAHGNALARCRAGYVNLAAEMVTLGLAVADLPRSRDYLPNHREARSVGRGIFGGVFVDPWDWRRGRRLDLEEGR